MNRPVLRSAWAAFLTGAAVVVFAERAAAEQRPSEDELFGGKPQAPKAAPAPAPGGSAAPPGSGSAAPPAGAPSAAPPAAVRGEAEPPAATAPEAPPATGGASPPSPANQGPATDTRDAAILGGKESAMFTEDAAPSDPLRIGGQIYLRSQMTALRGQRFVDYSFSAPSLVDAYFDARPNDRVRGFVLGRMIFDPTLPATAGGPGTGMLSATGSTSGSANLSSLFSRGTRTPSVVLDQLWLRFDVAHTVFVTAGKQHVRWGTGRFWAPTDFLHLRFRNPLDVFDARTGTTMIKLHVPVESKAWNFYAYGVTENPDATQTLSRIAGAARAEFVFESAELGLGAFVRRDQDPKVAADLSVGIGDFDLYGEVALKNSSEIDRVRYDPSGNGGPPADTTATLDVQLRQTANAYFPAYREHDYRPQAVGGLNYSRKYNDNDTFTVGAEYFYNGLGYDNSDAYLGLVVPHTYDLAQPAPFFYLGRHYGALYVTFPAPFKLDLHTFTLSTLGNLSDKSFITRLDYSLVLLTHLTFQAFASARYGNPEGEFRFGVNRTLGTFPISFAPAIFDVGLALRLAI